MRPQMRWPLAALATLSSALLAGGPARSDDAHAPASPSTTSKPIAHGEGPAYRTLGQIATMHHGRIKPLDTVAREEVKQVYTRETIKLPGVDGKPGSTWTPVAAFLDWSTRPKFWDDQPIIAVEYLPLKQKIRAAEVHETLDAIAEKPTTPATAKKRLEELAHQGEADAAELRNVVRDSGLPEADGRAILALAAKLGEETKWMTPAELEEAQVTVDGKPTPCFAWLGQLAQRRQQEGENAKLTEVEKKALEVAGRVFAYRTIRDKLPGGDAALMVMPRPANDAMLAYTARVIEEARERGESSMTPLGTEALETLSKYFADVPKKDQALPGTNPEFDARYKQWVKDRSAWVPLAVVRGASVDELARAGFPTKEVEAFRTAFDAVEAEELLHPGTADPKPALALTSAAHMLGSAVNPDYPSPEAMAREAHFNDVAPFFKAPWAYLVGTLLLSFSLMAGNFGRSMQLEPAFGKLARGLYLAGLMGFAAGIGLEVYGFYLRVRITGWAPVSNMYETVIWVALVSSVLGLIIEAIHRRTYAALAASGVAMVCTALAANTDILDPTITTLRPVLRSNLWLTIHVLTIVSSYAAFALAMGLGMVATLAYLTATYKRSAPLGESIAPLAAGLPILGLGLMMGYGHDRFDLGPIWARYGSFLGWGVASVGGVLCGMAAFALIGELVNRVIFERQMRREGLTTHEPADFFDPARQADVRGRAMQRTAAAIKPMANFIYRSMQVGILLVAAGTFLGGWWADVSWGRFWGWDPKEVWALITLLVYLMPLHGRFAGWVNTFWLVMSSVVCFLSVLMAWYGVNFVLGVGLHSYGFGSNGGQGAVLVTTLGVLSIAAGAFWRRRLASRVVEVA